MGATGELRPQSASDVSSKSVALEDAVTADGTALDNLSKEVNATMADLANRISSESTATRLASDIFCIGCAYFMY